jgi:hypothetical protein
LPRQSFTGAALLASPWLSESMNTSMLRRSASMHGAMLPLTSMRKTRSATPLVFARACGAAAPCTGSATPAPAAAGSAIGAVSPGATDPGGRSAPGVSPGVSPPAAMVVAGSGCSGTVMVNSG